jgi:hypothetical protein
MQAAVHPSLYPSLAIAALVIWRLYARIRRVVGRQKLSTVRPWLTVTLFPLLLALMMLGAMTQPLTATALLAGCGIGVALGIVGHRLTSFEVTPQGLYYTPNAHLGIALSLLFAGRIAWRFVQLNLNTAAPASPYSASFVSSPLTLLIFGTLAGYYVSYAVGLLRWHRRVGDSLPIETPPNP